MSIRIVSISDTHMWGMPLEKIPRGDILIHSGDGTYRGTISEINRFYNELIKHKRDTRYGSGFKEIIFVPGNHDFGFEKQEYTCRDIMSEIRVLINEDYHYYHDDGDILKIWGSPVCPPFGPWAFYQNGEERKKLWDTIPDDTDIVVTHGPAKGILDEVVEIRKNKEGIKHTGCEYLHNRIFDINPIIHQCGHIHEGYGWTNLGNSTTNFVNASIMDERYNPVNKPIVMDVLIENNKKHVKFIS